MAVHSARIKGIDIPYRIKRSTRAKRARIQVSAADGIVVILPPGYYTAHAGDVLNENSAWVVKQYCKLRDKPRVYPEFSFKSGSFLPYLGRLHRLAVNVGNGNSARVIRNDGEIVVILPPGLYGDVSRIREILRRWYRGQAHREIIPRVCSYAQLLSVGFNRIAIKDQRTVWGSCSRKGNLNFNYRLVMAPEKVLEYIIVHELSHLKEPNHSPRFWKVVESVMPDYRAVRKWIKEYGHELTL